MPDGRQPGQSFGTIAIDPVSINGPEIHGPEIQPYEVSDRQALIARFARVLKEQEEDLRRERRRGQYKRPHASNTRAGKTAHRYRKRSRRTE